MCCIHKKKKRETLSPIVSRGKENRLDDAFYYKVLERSREIRRNIERDVWVPTRKWKFIIIANFSRRATTTRDSIRIWVVQTEAHRRTNHSWHTPRPIITANIIKRIWSKGCNRKVNVLLRVAFFFFIPLRLAESLCLHTRVRMYARARAHARWLTRLASPVN